MKGHITDNEWLLSEWNWAKNNQSGFDPNTITLGSGKLVWWKCRNGHEWQATVYNRAKGINCPYCAGKRAIEGINDLSTINPALAKQWHPTKNGMRKPTQYLMGSNEKVWWVCEKGHEWEASIVNRSKGRGCPICANRIIIEGINDLATKNPALAKEWHPTKNGNLMPSDVAGNSGKTIWWICEKGHEWQATVDSRSQGRGCPICANRRVLQSHNDLFTEFPEIAREWHPTKNGSLMPTDVISGSGKKVWWMCSKGHEWKTTIVSRTSGNKCPYCSNKKLLIGYNDLATTNPEVAAEWHPMKNGNLQPSEVKGGSGKRVWWLCKNGHEWQAPIIKRRYNGCPYCSGRNAVTGENDILSQNPLLASEFNLRNAMSAVPIPEDDVTGRSRRINLCPEEWEDDFGEGFYEHILDNGFYYLTPEKEWRTSVQSVPAPGVKQYAVPDESELQMSMESLMRGIGTNDGITE